MHLPFKKFHTLQALREFEEQHLPPDVFLRCYFRKHKAVGAHDRRYISETLYGMIRQKGLILSLCKADTSPENRLFVFENLDPETIATDSSLLLHEKLSFPQPYFQLLCQALGEEKAIEFCTISNGTAPLTVRVNTIKISREALSERFRSAGIETTPGNLAPTALHLRRRINFFLLPEFSEGLFEVQDESCQAASLLSGIRPGELFLDYCAGSGGKSLAVAPLTEGKGQLYLYDIRTKPLEEAKKRMKRAGIQNGQIVFPGELRKKNLYGKMDVVFVDAPCSGSGTLRRNPDMKWQFCKETFQKLLITQREVFEEALTFVKPGGRIIYATCSVFPEENEQQIEYFLKKFSLSPVNPPFQTFPSENGPDGFYARVLQKT